MNGARSRNASLQASRRVDWRFLLPDPQLKHVAYVGRRDHDLVESLRLFSATLESPEEQCPASAALADRTFDLVVARDPQLEDLIVATRLLRRDGSIYVEIGGCAARRIPFQKPGTLHGLVARLERLGFADVALHWHWPDFASCTHIVPLADTAAVRHALTRRQRVRMIDPALVMARLLVRTRLLAWVVASTSVIARWPGGSGERSS